MPVFYKGAGVGTYWHRNDPRTMGGFTCGAPSFVMAVPDPGLAASHIAHGSTVSPYVSLSTSFDVAVSYAEHGQAPPTRTVPGLVYSVSIDATSGVRLVDPLELIASAHSPFAHNSYRHDGPQDLLYAVLNPQRYAHLLGRRRKVPPGSGMVRTPANVSPHLVAMVRALRDCEVLVVGTVPAACVFQVHRVY